MIICRETQQDLFNVMGALYAAVLFLGVNNAASVQPVVAVERSVYYRERAAGMYAALPYAIAQVCHYNFFHHLYMTTSRGKYKDDDPSEIVLQ